MKLHFRICLKLYVNFVKGRLSWTWMLAIFIHNLTKLRSNTLKSNGKEDKSIVIWANISLVYYEQHFLCIQNALKVIKHASFLSRKRKTSDPWKKENWNKKKKKKIKWDLEFSRLSLWANGIARLCSHIRAQKWDKANHNSTRTLTDKEKK